ncbi:MAG: DUF6988 family protein [Terriglobales bacterium]
MAQQVSASDIAPDVQADILRSKDLCEKLEHLVVGRKEFPHVGRNLLLVCLWSLFFEQHKGALTLLSWNYPGAALALLRPIVETVVRAHVVAEGSDDDVDRIRNDKYRTNFSTIGKWIDETFQMRDLFEQFLKDATRALHSYTHSGMWQISRRFDKDGIGANYPKDELLQLIRIAESGAFMMTILLTVKLGYQPEWEEANRLFTERAQRSAVE